MAAENGQIEKHLHSAEADCACADIRPASAVQDKPSDSGEQVKVDDRLDRLIEEWKRKLLDTGKRNQMINYRRTRLGTLQIQAPEASVLFNRLAFSDKPLSFQKPISKHADIRTYAVISLMEALSYDLKVQSGDIKTDCTVMEQEKTLKHLRAKAKLAQQEQGTNILFLCFGFIYWSEKNKPLSPLLKSPLLLMPVSLELRTLNSPYTISRLDDDIEVNPTLDHYFSTEYHINLPPFDLKNKASFDEYFSAVEKLMDGQGWRVTREVSLAAVSFLKISMYHDLNNNRALILQHPVLRAIAGDPSALPTIPEYASGYDSDSTHPEQWHEVVDSDSSQEQAILLSKLGISFVLQGPPGTGKSQTITNIIAEALGEGKKVLFVSEKAAALQVVQKRLSETGLADFCLPMHNYKANKKEIVNSIGANLRFKHKTGETDAASVLSALYQNRQFLNQYANELHKKIQPLDKSVYEAFGRLADLAGATDVDFLLDDPAAITKQEFAEIEFCVTNFENTLRQFGGPIHANPWRGTKATSSSQAYKHYLETVTAQLSADLRSLAKGLLPLSAALDIPFSNFRDAQRLLEICQLLGDRPPFVNRRWGDPAHASSAKALLSEVVEHITRMRETEDILNREWMPAVLSLDLSAAEPFFSEAYANPLCAGKCSIDVALDAEYRNAQSLLQILWRITAAFQDGLRLIQYDAADCMEDIQMLSKTLVAATSAPHLELGWFDPQKNQSYAFLRTEAAEHSSALRNVTATILSQWESSVLSLDAEDMLKRFKSEYTGVFRKLSVVYKRDMRQIRACTKTVGAKVEDEDAIRLLQEIAERNTELSWFTKHVSELSEAFGDQYRGAQTDWDGIRQGLHYAKSIAGLFPYSVVPPRTISALAGITRDTQLFVEAQRIASVLSAEAIAEMGIRLRSCAFLPGKVCKQSVSQAVKPQLQQFLRNCSAAMDLVASVQPLKQNGQVLVDDFLALRDQLKLLAEEHGWFQSQIDRLEKTFGHSNSWERFNWEDIVRGIELMERLNTIFNGKIPETVVDAACATQDNHALNKEYLASLRELLQRAEAKLSLFNHEFENPDFTQCALEEVAARYDACMRDFLSLNQWLDYTEAKAECDRHGLSRFTDRIAVMDNSVPDVKAAFERGFYLQWLNWKLEQVPAVRSFRRRIFEQHIERFSELDTRQFEIAKARIREKIITAFPNINSVSRAGSELSILRHEMEKKQRIMPLRKLFHSIPKLLLTLKPCLMMSPLSVAHFLEPNDFQFDLVIFDEASQIFPQDAIGAIMRAKQVIIAGDTKQLPPTNFFTSISSGQSEYDVSDEDAFQETQYDSILENAANVLPNRPLLWHYRSKHEHLISFSNENMYRNELVTFPSSREREEDTGVEFVYVEDGIYEPTPKNRNIPEAKRISSLVEQHIRRHPERSLGVIAFSEKQQQAISDEIHRMREKHPEYDAFFAEGTEEDFFVKNLENVQGDERDTIFISIGYGKTKAQKSNNRPMSLRFGPLGNSGGERRLNVAITRSKVNVKLISSIRDTDIDETKTNSAGIKLLRAYLKFAETGEAAPSSSQSDNQDEFVETVARFISAGGYEVQTGIGCSDFKLDIAVCDPESQGTQYVAGILCDGQSYRSALTARDRERLRNTVLKQMGWNLYHVWSPEWINNPEVEGQKLLNFLKQAAACGTISG